MIASPHRFHGRGSLNFVYSKGRAIRGESISARYVRGRQKDYRAAIVVSKKVSKSAVVRNRIRRRIYETIRLYRKEMTIEWPYDIVVSVFDDRAATMPAEELQTTVKSLLKKINN